MSREKSFRHYAESAIGVGSLLLTLEPGSDIPDSHESVYTTPQDVQSIDDTESELRQTSHPYWMPTVANRFVRPE
jgi:hypothetical protein